MDWLEFLAAVLGALAWPASIFGIVLLFRKQILSIFERAEEVGYGDLTVKLSEGIDDAEEVAKALPPPPEPADVDIKSSRDLKFTELVSISPNAAILEEWREIQTRLELMGERLGLNEIERRSFPRIADALRGHPLFPDSLVSLIQELRDIRNSAAHSIKVETIDARRFKELSDQVFPFLQPSLFNQN